MFQKDIVLYDIVSTHQSRPQRPRVIKSSFFEGQNLKPRDIGATINMYVGGFYLLRRNQWWHDFYRITLMGSSNWLYNLASINQNTLKLLLLLLQVSKINSDIFMTFWKVMTLSPNNKFMPGVIKIFKNSFSVIK